MREMMRDVWRFADKWIGDKERVNYLPEDYCAAVDEIGDIVVKYPGHEAFMRHMLMEVYNEIVRRDIDD